MIIRSNTTVHCGTLSLEHYCWQQNSSVGLSSCCVGTTLAFSSLRYATVQYLSTTVVILHMLDKSNEHAKHRYVLQRSQYTRFMFGTKYTVLNANINVRSQ